jgi:hypothetical protein
MGSERGAATPVAVTQKLGSAKLSQARYTLRRAQHDGNERGAAAEGGLLLRLGFRRSLQKPDSNATSLL